MKRFGQVCFQIDMLVLAALDGVAFLTNLFIGFGPRASVNTRKVLLIICTYFTGNYLLLYIGFKEPGFLFLYASCVFTIVIFQSEAHASHLHYEILIPYSGFG